MAFGPRMNGNEENTNNFSQSIRYPEQNQAFILQRKNKEAVVTGLKQYFLGGRGQF